MSPSKKQVQVFDPFPITFDPGAKPFNPTSKNTKFNPEVDPFDPPTKSKEDYLTSWQVVAAEYSGKAVAVRLSSDHVLLVCTSPSFNSKCSHTGLSCFDWSTLDTSDNTWEDREKNNRVARWSAEASKHTKEWSTDLVEECTEWSDGVTSLPQVWSDGVASLPQEWSDGVTCFPLEWSEDTAAQIWPENTTPDWYPGVTNTPDWSPGVTNTPAWSPVVTNAPDWSHGVTNTPDWSPVVTNASAWSSGITPTPDWVSGIGTITLEYPTSIVDTYTYDDGVCGVQVDVPRAGFGNDPVVMYPPWAGEVVHSDNWAAGMGLKVPTINAEEKGTKEDKEKVKEDFKMKVSSVASTKAEGENNKQDEIREEFKKQIATKINFIDKERSENKIKEAFRKQVLINLTNSGSVSETC